MSVRVWRLKYGWMARIADGTPPTFFADKHYGGDAGSHEAAQRFVTPGELPELPTDPPTIVAAPAKSVNLVWRLKYGYMARLRPDMKPQFFGDTAYGGQEAANAAAYAWVQSGGEVDSPLELFQPPAPPAPPSVKPERDPVAAHGTIVLWQGLVYGAPNYYSLLHRTACPHTDLESELGCGRYVPYDENLADVWVNQEAIDFAQSHNIRKCRFCFKLGITPGKKLANGKTKSYINTQGADA